jgi:uncharacterized protein YsxB (DUF464 family)
MKLKATLLGLVLDNIPVPNKYSKSFLNLENVFELERDEGFTFPEHINKKFDEIRKKYNNFINGIPLIVIERYYMDYRDDYKKYVYLEYEGKELDEMTIMELFVELEKFYNQMFKLACILSNYYNLEVKLNAKNNSFDVNSKNNKKNFI